MIAKFISGISIKAAFVIGLALGAAPSAFAAYKLGHWVGYDAGFAAADKQAEINSLNLELNTVRADLALTARLAEQHREVAQKNGLAWLHAKEAADEYEKKLQALGPTGACDLTDSDVRELQQDRSRRGVDRASSSHAPAR